MTFSDKCKEAIRKVIDYVKERINIRRVVVHIEMERDEFNGEIDRTPVSPEDNVD